VWLMTAKAISMFGSRMTFVALPWLVLVTTGSATRTGVVAFAEMLPYVIATAAGGPLIDRLGARRMSVVSDVASAIVVAGVAVLAQAEGMHFGLLVALVAIAGLVRGLGDTAKQVLFPAAVRAAGVDMTRATAIMDGINRASILIGAPLAGVLVAVTDSPTVLLLDAVSFLVCAAIVAAAVHLAATASPEDRDESSYLQQLRGGLSFVRQDKLLLGIMAMLFVTNLIDQANGSVLIPVWSKDIYGSPLGIGLVSAAFAAGAVTGNLAYLWLAPRLPRFAPFAVGFLIGGAPRLVAMALDTPLWTILAISASAGVAISVVNPILMAVMVERVPQHLQARVYGLSTALAWAGIPIGSVLGGWLADQVGVQAALLSCAAVYFVATLLPFMSKVWRQMDRAPETATPERVPAARRPDVSSPAVEAEA